MTDQYVAFVGATVIDGTGREPIGDGVVLCSGSQVKQVGKKGRVTIPSDCKVVDVAGKTVMPGMFDCHVHISYITPSFEQQLFTDPTVHAFQTAAMMKRTLHAGFTTIRDAAGCELGLRTAVEMGLIEGPRMVISGTIGQTGGYFDRNFPCGANIPWPGGEIADGVPAVQASARRQLRKGVDFLKVYSSGDESSLADSPDFTEFTIEELKAIVVEATARGKAVMAHAEGVAGIKNALRAGVWTVEEPCMLDDEAVQLFLDHKTYAVPSLQVFDYMALHGKDMGVSPEMMERMKKLGDGNVESFQRLAAAGVKIAVGSDIFEEGAHGTAAAELASMVKHGFTPMQAIVAATRTSAEACRLDQKVGTLEPGKFADLLVVDGDPLKGIQILQDQSKLLMVMKEGKAYVDLARLMS